MAVNVAAVSTLSTLVYWLAWKHELLDPRPSRAGLRGYLVAGMIPAAVFLASVPIAILVTPTAAKLSWLSLRKAVG